jgi:TfoX/Sxy family transcriptional regulator of competence genes
MAYDERVVNRLRTLFGNEPDLVVKKMFGGVGFILSGNMAVGVLNEELLVRITPEQREAALAEPHVRLADVAGRPIRGWVIIAPEGFANDATLERWVRQGVAVARSLPPK